MSSLGFGLSFGLNAGKGQKNTTLSESFTESIKRKLVGSFEASEPGPPLGGPGYDVPLESSLIGWASERNLFRRYED